MLNAFVRVYYESNRAGLTLSITIKFLIACKPCAVTGIFAVDISAVGNFAVRTPLSKDVSPLGHLAVKTFGRGTFCRKGISLCYVSS